MSGKQELPSGASTPAIEKPKHTPGPWRWQGEDYRAGWGWQMLVGPNGEGLIVGQDNAGEPCSQLRAFMPVDAALCITGLAAEGKPRVQSVHVFSEANARLIAAAPDLLNVCQRVLKWEDTMNWFEPVPSDIAESLRAAISKALGGER